ncbi:MAG: cupin domain-containing protein [Ignavibacteriaceae bacterium]
MDQKARTYIKKLRLKKHPEGGYYREVYRSDEKILTDHLPKRYRSSRNFSTSIYFLLEGNQFSAFHLLKSDELWHFYDGSAVMVYVINPVGDLTVSKLGRSRGTEFQTIIQKKCWFAAEAEDKKSFSLFGCTVAPGFEFEDFEMGRREFLLKKFPQHQTLIHRLTRLP